ncbi:MAG: metallophosphoesterase [Gammaproteobacteria bacterium]
MAAGLLSATAALAQDEWRLSDVERVVAVADIHGAYPAFQHILQRTGVVDNDLRWTGGRTHLVIVGDVLDRGADSRLALELIRALEAAAPEAGGQVHYLLGNHEIMNMTGDLRYVSPGEFSAFADEEPAEVREAEFVQFVESLGDSADVAAAREQFDADYPPGFFAHRQAFASDGEYGEWLLDKPVLLVIDDLAFVHAGLAQAVIGNAGRINSQIRSELRAFLSAYERLVSASVISRTVELYDLPARVTELLEDPDAADSVLAGGLRTDARRLQDLASLSFLSADGPVWYRGNVACNRLTEQDRLAAALGNVGAAQLVVGHTPTRGAVVLSRMDETLLRIDTGMLNDYYGGRASALVVENGTVSVMYEDEVESSAPLPQPRWVGFRPGNRSAEGLEAALQRAEVVARQSFDSTAALLSLVDGEFELEGLFTRAERETVNAAVAAYRLDRLLGLDMVPVTVAREIDGVSGALQFWPQGTISEPERSAGQLGGSAWCPLGDQFQDMYLFDALIFNQGRTPDRIRYSTENFQLLLMGHDVTFATEQERPPHLAELPVVLTPAWRAALEGLDQRTLNAALGDVLDRRRIRAVLARRDHLLDLAQ